MPFSARRILRCVPSRDYPLTFCPFSQMGISLMMSSPPPKSVGQSGSEWQRFLKLAKQVSETIGAEFFSTLVNQLREVLGAECVYIGEFVLSKPDRVRTLAAFVEGKGLDILEFPLAGSPDAEVAAGNPCMYTSGVREIFPRDCRL